MFVIVTRDFCSINWMNVIDGVTSNPIQLEKAYKLGAKHIFLLWTLPVDYVSDWSLENLINPYFYSGYEKF